MAQVLGAVFGAPEVPDAPVEQEETRIDPNRDAELAAAARRKRSIFARRGRGFLGGKGGQTRGGVSIKGSFGGGAAQGAVQRITGGKAGKPTGGGSL